MAKLFTLVIAVAAVFAAASAEDVKPNCSPVNLQDSTAIKGFNGLIQTIRSFPSLLQSRIPDPLSVTNKTLDMVKFNPYGSLNLEVTPTIQSLAVTGLSSVAIEDIKPNTPNTLSAGINFGKEVSAKATLRLLVAETNRKWYTICWTNLFKPIDCPPLFIEVDMELGIVAPKFHTDVQFDMLECTENPEKTCNKFDLGVEVLTPATGLPATADKVAIGVQHFVKRIKAVVVNGVSFEFDSVSAIGFHFHSSGAFVTEMGQKLFSFTKNEINKKAGFYNFIVNNFHKHVTTLANQLITERLAPQFGATCRN
ncbi:TPA: hypothetical protein N0F65_003481 [Lagenidium giganteum]|uniref:Lipid-binding serum glycoprotein N-terminal domain-containing protein n=1 Tax=Lagenidium giganteum TaxID=4803 RepID=A0AAV2YJ59_9STRA|nr:TPA: hypothetical protein N0F65_003481 [Lagenidium giganteum]